MNEKIRLLAEQAGYQEGFRFALEDFDLEKFAELIVKECLRNMENEIDNDALNLAKAIRQKESGGNFNAIGDNGTSKGAYQWQPGTWKAHAKQVLGNENAPMTREILIPTKMKPCSDSTTPRSENSFCQYMLRGW